jgi:murein DD-endopeptidase MepM/ murein hydrolase activator NlpD
VPGRVGSGFRTADRPGHDGVDIMAPRGTGIRSASAGIVITVVCNVSRGTCDQDGSPSVMGCGWYVEVAHGAGLMTRYCHMVRQPSVTVGQRVEAGELLGYVGTSGNSSGPHLHYEVHVLGDAIDPVSFMESRGAPLGERG